MTSPASSTEIRTASPRCGRLTFGAPGAGGRTRASAAGTGSPLLWEGRSTTYVANQLGHSIATLSKHYAGVIAELEAGAERVPANEAIRQARDKRRALREAR